MTAKEQLLNEIENAPDAMVEEILDFCLFLKQRRQAKESAASVPQTNVLKLTASWIALHG